MDFCFIFTTVVILYHLIEFLMLIFFDCDVNTKIAELFGKPRETLQNKIIWITGASSGIGEHLAQSCAKVGAKLVLSARRKDELERVKKDCLQLSEGKLNDADILVLPMDITDLESHNGLYQQVLKHFGDINILVNNAGRSQRAQWHNTEIKVDESVFKLNVFAVVHLSRIVLDHFMTKGYGHFAVTSSTAGYMGVPFSCSYTGSKHAIHGYFDSLRTEMLLKNIDVTIFCPGPTFTNFLQESFTGSHNEKYGQSTQPTDKRMTGERCGDLFAIALANKIEESWVAVFPIVFVSYLNRYYPNLLRLITKLFGPKVFMKLRDNRESVKSE